MGLLAGNNTQQILDQMTAEMEAAKLYFGHATDNAWDEACWLLETIMHRQGVDDLSPDTVLTSAQLEQVQALFSQRLQTRKPLAYLLEEAWFCGLPFYVNEHVLVPRSPLSELIQQQFDPLLQDMPARILDLCTGGGCIGIACALAFPDARVVLSDISEAALAVARVNVERYELQERVTVVKSDLFAALTGPFDLIVSNPPYVGQSEYDALPAEYKNEPVLGLVTAGDGLAIPHTILEQAAQYLSPNGLLVLETGATWERLAESRPALPFLWLDFEHGGEGVCALYRDQLPA